MALSGSCPGTVLSQVALGIRSGYYALGGATLGGIAWTGLLNPWLSRRSPNQSAEKGKLTIHEALGLSQTTALVGFETLLSATATIAALATTTGPDAGIHPIVGGLLVGGAQLLSLLLRKSLIGVSTSYEEIGEWFWSAIRGGGVQKYTSILFSLGVLSGSWLVGYVSPHLAKPGEANVSPFFAAAGGFFMVVGSRMAGGCTSGHGISGMSLLSTSSVITMGAAFGWGVAVTKLIG